MARYHKRDVTGIHSCGFDLWKSPSKLWDTIMAGRASKRRSARCFLNGMCVAQVIKCCCIVTPGASASDWHNLQVALENPTFALTEEGLLRCDGWDVIITLHGGWSGRHLGLTEGWHFLFGFLQIRYKHLFIFYIFFKVTFKCRKFYSFILCWHGG